MIKKTLRWLKRIFILLWLIVAAVVGAWLWYENKNAVTVTYFGHQIQEQTLGTIMTGMLLVGFVLGFVPLMITSLMRESAHKRHIHKLQKQHRQQLSNSSSASSA